MLTHVSSSRIVEVTSGEQLHLRHLKSPRHTVCCIHDVLSTHVTVHHAIDTAAEEAYGRVIEQTLNSVC